MESFLCRYLNFTQQMMSVWKTHWCGTDSRGWTWLSCTMKMLANLARQLHFMESMCYIKCKLGEIEQRPYKLQENIEDFPDEHRQVRAALLTGYNLHSERFEKSR